MKLLVQPDDGVSAIVKGIERAKQSVEILIFRLDRKEIEKALIAAAHRGVHVRALIAYTNRGGEKHLRALEMRMLAAGITVARTADDLVRYHGKMMIVDSKELYILGYNFTHMDIDHSRSFGVIVRDKALVAEAVRLFDADAQRQPYAPGKKTKLVVSPLNARAELADFIGGAKKSLLIYDLEISDKQIVDLLQDRIKDNVGVRVIGKTKKAAKLETRKLSTMRLHARTIVRDGAWVFLGSQSLCTMELDRRREVGIIFRNARIAGLITKTFTSDWEAAEPAAEVHVASAPAKKMAKRVAKKVASQIPDLAGMEGILFDAAAKEGANVDLSDTRVRENIEEAVKEAVKDAVHEMIVEGAA